MAGWDASGENRWREEPMASRRRPAIIAIFTVLFSSLLISQKTTQIHPGRGGSPHVRSEWVIDGANIAIEYGRPFLKGRSESEMMPAATPWRTGADEGTTLRTDKRLKFDALTVPAGTYS